MRDGDGVDGSKKRGERLVKVGLFAPSDGGKLRLDDSNSVECASVVPVI